MTILRELWVNDTPDEELVQTYEYLLDLRSRIEQTCELARDNLRDAQGRYKVHFNRKAKARSLEVGDKALILLPTDSNKLLMQWKGPYRVIEKVGLNDYRVEIGDNKKLLLHINMMKKYYARKVYHDNCVHCFGTVRK